MTDHMSAATIIARIEEIDADVKNLFTETNARLSKRGERIKELEAQIADLRSSRDEYALRELARAGQDCEAGWQPIETAPKDGTVILTDCGTAKFGTVSGWAVVKDVWMACSYQGDTYDCTYYGEFRVDATRWMPLPDAPKEQANE